MANPLRKKYRTTRDIVIPKGHTLIYASRMKHDVLETVMAVVSIGNDRHYDWFMARDDALAAGLIEEIS
jgi:hypothetical protein